MRSRDRRGARRRLRPILEGLEMRELPSAPAPSAVATAVVAHPDSPNGLLGKRAPGPFLNRALLRVVYRVLFWFVAEDRDALLLPIPAGSDAEDVSAETRDAIASDVSAETSCHAARCADAERLG